MNTNKINILTAKIGMWFIVTRDDVINPRFCTSKPGDNNFGNWILEKREVTTLEMVELEEKARRRNKAVYKESFKICCSEKKDITELLLALSTIISMLSQPRSL